MFLNAIPVRELVCTTVGATKRDICLATTWHMIHEGTEVAMTDSGKLISLAVNRFVQLRQLSTRLCDIPDNCIYQELSNHRLNTAVAIKWDFQFLNKSGNGIINAQLLLAIEITTTMALSKVLCKRGLRDSEMSSVFYYSNFAMSANSVQIELFIIHARCIGQSTIKNEILPLLFATKCDFMMQVSCNIITY